MVRKRTTLIMPGHRRLVRHLQPQRGPERGPRHQLRFPGQSGGSPLRLHFIGTINSSPLRSRKKKLHRRTHRREGHRIQWHGAETLRSSPACRVDTLREGIADTVNILFGQGGTDRDPDRFQRDGRVGEVRQCPWSVSIDSRPSTSRAAPNQLASSTSMVRASVTSRSKTAIPRITCSCGWFEGNPDAYQHRRIGFDSET